MLMQLAPSNIQPSWSPSSKLLPLKEGDVHIWSFHTSRPSKDVESLCKVISPEEMNRAMRMRSLEVREQAIVSRAVLRLFLSGYLGVTPLQLQFSTTGMGKPMLQGTGLHFNLSHSHGIGLLAITRVAEIGVDIEKIRHMENMLFLAQRFFSPWESQYLGSQEGADLGAVFFQAWTRKEAFLKANGHGIGFGLDRVEVALGRHESPRLRQVDGNVTEAASWTVLHLEPCKGFMGAAAIKVPNVRPLTWHWEGKELPQRG